MLEEVRARFKDQGVDEVGCAVRMTMASAGYVVGPFGFIGLEQSLISSWERGAKPGRVIC